MNKPELTKQTLDTTDEAARLYQSEVGGDDEPVYDDERYYPS